MITKSSLSYITDNNARDFNGASSVSGKRLGERDRYRDSLSDNRFPIQEPLPVNENSNDVYSMKVPKPNTSLFSYHPEELHG